MNNVRAGGKAFKAKDKAMVDTCTTCPLPLEDCQPDSEKSCPFVIKYGLHAIPAVFMQRTCGFPERSEI